MGSRILDKPNFVDREGHQIPSFRSTVLIKASNKSARVSASSTQITMLTGSSTELGDEKLREINVGVVFAARNCQILQGVWS